MSDVVVVDYGAGNTRSVQSALMLLGRDSVVSSASDDIRDAEYVILPGVGSARSAMDHLSATGAAAALTARFRAGKSMLGICLGMQLAMHSSSEDGGVDTLGLLVGTVERLATLPVPRLGWARVTEWGESFYFAHSYVVNSPDQCATSDGVCAAVRRDGFLGVQFHPEKSGPAGLRFLEQCLSLA